MSKFNLCYPYGPGVSCICDSRSRIFKCFPSSAALDGTGVGAGGAGGAEDLNHLDTEALLARGQVVSERFVSVVLFSYLFLVAEIKFCKFKTS